MSEVISPFAGFSWYQTVKAKMGKIPEYIWGSIVGVESQGNPNAIGDGGKSIGLFQHYTNGGLGDAYKDNPQALFDPELNARIAAETIRPAYEAGLNQGLTGYKLLEYTASHAGFPLMTGNMPESYRGQLVKSYGSYAAGSDTSVPDGHAGGVIGEPPISTKFGIFGALTAIENIELSALHPIDSTKKLATMVLLVVLGLILVAIGLIAFVGFGKTASVVANVAVPGSGKVLDAASTAAKATKLEGE